MNCNVGIEYVPDFSELEKGIDKDGNTLCPVHWTKECIRAARLAYMREDGSLQGGTYTDVPDYPRHYVRGRTCPGFGTAGTDSFLCGRSRRVQDSRKSSG